MYVCAYFCAGPKTTKQFTNCYKVLNIGNGNKNRHAINLICPTSPTYKKLRGETEQHFSHTELQTGKESRLLSAPVMVLTGYVSTFPV